jgi:hypothetical protein
MFIGIPRLSVFPICLHTAGVAGSIPAAPTIYSSCFKGLRQSAISLLIP